MSRLLLLFVVVPAVELALLIRIGSAIGTVATIALVIGTGVLGASLARHQGLGVIREMQAELARGRLPASSLLDAAIILVASALLVTPGVLTDAAGFLALIPAVRGRLKTEVRRRIERAREQGRIHVAVDGDFRVHPPGPIYDVTPDDGPPRPPS